MDFWKRQPDFEVRMPTEDEDFPPRLHLRWTDEDCTAEAWMDRVGLALRVTELRVWSDHGLPAQVRRLPSDAQVLQSLRMAGPPGVAHISFVLGDRAGLSEAFERAGGGTSPHAPAEVFDEASSAYYTEFMKRPRQRMDDESEEVVEWIRSGRATKDIIDELCARGRSERTAYRRLEKANALIEDDKTKGMEGQLD